MRGERLETTSGPTTGSRDAWAGSADERPSAEAADWATRLLTRRPFKVAAVALANKMARIAWALLARGGTYTTTAAA